MSAVRITFPGSSGQALAARLDAPTGARGYSLFAHCFYLLQGLYRRAAYRGETRLQRHRSAVYARTLIDGSTGNTGKVRAEALRSTSNYP